MAAALVVGATAGEDDHQTCIELDDARITKMCRSRDMQFGFARHLSTPSLSRALIVCGQAGWDGPHDGVDGNCTSNKGH